MRVPQRKDLFLGLFSILMFCFLVTQPDELTGKTENLSGPTASRCEGVFSPYCSPMSSQKAHVRLKAG